MNYWKLGCRWGAKKSGFPLFLDILQNNKIVISWEDKDYGLNTPILLTDGHTAIAYAITISTAKTLYEVPHLKKDFADKKISMEYGLRIYDAEIHLIPKDLQFQYSLVQGICEIQQQDIIDKLSQIIYYTNSMEQLQSKVNVLKYKKQIILQGPPGTGKTKFAKEIAQELISNDSIVILNECLKKGQTIPNATGVKDYYMVEDVTGSGVVFSSERATKKWTASFSKIQDKIEQLQKNEVPQNKGGNDPYELAAANYIYENYFNSESKSQIKLVQFHPSYSYEDFVRGIVAKPNPDGDGILYEAENKTLGLFAKEALKNYQNSKKTPELISKEIWVGQQYQKFKDDLKLQLEKGTAIIIKEGTVPKIIAIEESATRVNRYDNVNDKVLLRDADIIYGYVGMYLTENVIKVKENNNLSKSARSGMDYLYQNLIKKFKDFLDENKILYIPQSNIQTQKLKNYVLIIDEINRANLSSVLGELIYALEYRGENVESMYKVGDSNKLTLPPNLYIIGTMNTADRSVGHIDYAIRRRFAFVDVLPKNLESELKDDFKVDLFAKVASLFIENYDVAIDYSDENVVMKKSEYMTADFDPKDVWLGHSYFIQHYEKNEIGEDIKEKPVDFTFRIRYEIKPILEEYIKDGILKESARSIINSL
jgi:hypothetical protein